MKNIDENDKLTEKLEIANKEIVFQELEKEKLSEELVIAIKELLFQNEEKEKRAAELIIANKELLFQNEEKEKRAAELNIANKELLFQNKEKEKRAAELNIANKELLFQNEEKEKRAAELNIANKELLFQNEEKEKRAAELNIANKELIFQNEEKEKRAAELNIANKELVFQNHEKEKRAMELEEKNDEVEAAKFDIEKKTKQLEVSSRYKSEFLANMSHELRTPLNSLLILSKDLADNKKKNLDPSQIESAEIIYNSGHDLLVLINEVLDLSKIESGKMTIQIDKVYLEDFTADMMRSFKHLAVQKGLNLTFSLHPNLPEFISTDLQRLNQILRNILSNAIKFTEIGTVHLEVKHFEKDINLIQISVIDTGIGIKEDKQGAIFEAFQQADGTTSRKYGGTGLGLSISRELAKLLNGKITLQSKFDQGSTFSFILPITTYESIISSTKIPLEKTKLKNQFIQNEHSLQNKTILLVDDDSRNVYALSKILKDLGANILTADNGINALSILEQNPNINLILMDIMMPEMDGYETMKVIRSLPQHQNLTIIALTAKAMQNDKQKCIDAGASNYISKPIDIDLLLTMVI